ncbi:class I SAM-dependent methyltransferase [Micromonospora sp. A3M-1-15]|uniref:SAM-dependent methyltransferase n=1 Tax=Micromonospora sp. A3M-1-15 TaxID=2962035 RepID=UPI0020B82BF9|nr:class I SAM-dependent methyltransferase [Micromonospora sp. A3M-1-15]MCP3783460.1 class I SAM-dependent methyltransferase [Micromonospora sp. A3M-1-15]
MTALDLPRSFTIREGDLRILNPFDDAKLATLGRAIKLRPGASILDLCSGKGELLCTWARDHGVTGTGVDISTAFTAAARERAAELGVADRVRFVHDDAATYVPEQRVDLAACVGATWIGGGVPGTLEILERGLRPGGMVLVGEPYWRLDPPDEETVAGCHARSREEFHDLPGLVGLFGECGWDLVEMVLADQDSWDRYAAAHWLNLRRWLDANPDDELAGELRRELTEDPLRHVRYPREYLGWGIFALLRR